MLGKVLVVDDERPLANALNLKLQKSGIDVTVAYSGVEALEKMKTEVFEVMLLDLMMPELDGFGVLEKLKKLNIKTKVVVTSNLSQEEDIARVKELGAVNYFVKSNTSISEIVDYVIKLLQHEQTQ